MPRKTSEINRFLNWYGGLGPDAKSVVADLCFDRFRQDRPKRQRASVAVSKRAAKSLALPDVGGSVGAHL